DNFCALMFLLIGGALLASIITTLFHELGHVFFGKKNGFAFVSMTIFFLKWAKIKKKIKFSFTSMGYQAGYTEMIPTTSDDVEKRFINMTRGGVLFSIIPTMLGVIPLFLSFLPMWAYCLWVMLLPVGVYSILDNILPMENEGVKNDGAVILGLKKQDDSSKVMVNLLKIQAESYQGKTPAEIDKDLYFELPQLREDDFNFLFLLNARYNYFLDLGDYENAKKTTERLLSLEEYFPKELMDAVKADALYNACTFDFDESKADDLTYEIEKYLNSNNNLTNVRIKLAYILFVKGEREFFDDFYKKGIKEASRCQIKGLANYETKLLNEIKEKYLTM
ncbi:MAG: hypothetical protein IKB98_06455, partial [Clostridia bacterium]|nr:hypothetical protein [Clostridia bacterium]